MGGGQSLPIGLTHLEHRMGWGMSASVLAWHHVTALSKSIAGNGADEPVVEKFGWQFRPRDKVIQSENVKGS